jgi:curved DNA-binding protein
MVIPTMDFKDYYKILGVEPTADDKAIKAAYRKLARKYHPDVSKEKDAEAKFKDASEAYEALKSADKRAEYDDLRRYGQHGQPFQGPPGWQSRGGFGGGGQDTGDFSDFFSSIFGNRGPGFWRQSVAAAGARTGRGNGTGDFSGRNPLERIEEGHLPGAAVQRRRPARQQHH